MTKLKKICFDYGHGGRDPGACFEGRREKDDTLYIGRRIASEIVKHGVQVYESRTRDKDMSLDARVNFERTQDFDLFISFHRNASLTGKARGAETFVYTNPSEKAVDLACNIQEALRDIGFINRGVKEATFYVLRKTKSPALLIELGFMDNAEDNKLFDDNIEKIVSKLSKIILKA